MEHITGSDVWTFGPMHGFFARNKEAAVIFVDHVSATWLRVQAEATHKPPAEIISELIREKIAVSL
jgi:hypothetical protein